MALDNGTLIDLTAEIVAAHVSHNNVAVESMAEVIQGVFAALQGLGEPVEPVAVKPTGAVSVRASVKPEYLISMIDGKRYKMLKRHLSLNGYTPESYREAFDLPKDYPMVSAEYAEKRRGLALKIGLGRKPKIKVKPRTKPKAGKAESAVAEA